MDTVINVENLWKEYRLGVISTGTLFRDLQSWWAQWRKKKDPNKHITGINPYTGYEDKNYEVKEDNASHFFALKNVSFEVKRGEVLGIIGKNGAGKSTLLKILSRVTGPTRGLIKIKGRVASLLEVGTGFHPELTGRENIFLNAAILGMSKFEVKSKLSQIVDFSELTKFIDTPVKRYSSGMYMRLAFAVAAHLEPDILVVDEVLAVGDVAFQQKCIGRMDEVSKEGRTVIVVSHNMTSITTLCTSALLMEKGEIICRGEVKEAINSYIIRSKNVSGQVSWSDASDMPGDESAKITAVRIRQEDSSLPVGEVDISKPVLIEIDYLNFIEGQLLYAGIHLLDHTGTPILSSSNMGEISLTPDQWSLRPHPKGQFTAICELPRDFLNDANYAITPIIGRFPLRTLAYSTGVLQFSVYDSGLMRKHDTNNFCGVIRPRLSWKTQQNN